MFLTELARRLWYFLRRDRVSDDLADEMRLHLELRAQRERQAGADPVEAHWRARRQFGSSVRLVESSRDQWQMRWVEDVVTDVRYGLRALRRTPLPSAVVIITLAVGIGATLAMFTVMDAALFRPLPVREPERLVIIPRQDVPLEGDRERVTPLSYQTLRERKDIYEDVGMYAAGGLNLTGGIEPIRVQAGLVTPSALTLLGVQPVRGRLFVEDEGRLGAPDVVILSHRLWWAQFNGVPDVVGRTLSLNDRTYEIVGVMPPRFAFPEGSDVWIPMTVPLSWERTQIFRFIISTTGVARLAPGVTRAQANAFWVSQWQAMGRRLPPGETYPDVNFSMRSYFVGDADSRVVMVMALAGLLLVAACANIAGLLLARWSARGREIAVRAAIGASRRRLLRQLTVESGVLAVLGAVVGLGVAAAGLRVFEALMPPDLAALLPPRIDTRVLVALLALTVTAAIAVGTLPAFAASRGDLAQTLKSGTPAGSRPRRRLGSALVVIETALAVVLLVGSGLLVKSLMRLHAVDTGLRVEQVVTARLALSRAKYSEEAARARFYAQLERELDAEAGLQTSALVSTLPLRGEWHPPVAFVLVDRPDLEGHPGGELVYATPDYFATMGIRVLDGRTFTTADTASTARGAIVSDSLAREWWPRSSPLGARISTGEGRATIVGVVNDVRGTALDGAPHPQFYLPFSTSLQATIVARSALPSAAAYASVLAAVQRVDPAQVLYDLKTMGQVAAESVIEQRATSALATVFAIITLVLAAVGLYGLLAYGVVQRTREFGVRFALGAPRATVVRSVVRDGVRLAVLGVAVGLAAALWGMRYVQMQLYGVTPTDATVYLIAPMVLVVTAFVAAMVPALRASRVDPLIALKAE